MFIFGILWINGRNMETTIKMNKQGCMVLPENVRIALGIEEGMEMVCRVVGSRVILEKFFMNSAKKPKIISQDIYYRLLSILCF